MQKIKRHVELAEGVLETEEGSKDFKHRSFLMRLYNEKLSRLS